MKAVLTLPGMNKTLLNNKSVIRIVAKSSPKMMCFFHWIQRQGGKLKTLKGTKIQSGMFKFFNSAFYCKYLLLYQQNLKGLPIVLRPKVHQFFKNSVA